MSKADWLYLSTTSGSGNATVSVSTHKEYTGRNARNTTLSITAANVEAKTVTVTQGGKPAYVDAVDNVTAEKKGQTVTISGKSNAYRLAFSLGSGNLEVSMPSHFTAAGISVSNGASITGDPGASAEYDFSIIIDVPENRALVDRTRQIIVSDDEGHSDVCLLTQTAGDAYLTVSKNTIELSYTGHAVSFDISSNTSWIIS